MDSWPVVWRRLTPARDPAFALAVTVLTLFGAYGEAHPHRISDEVLSGSTAAHTPAAASALRALPGLVLAACSGRPRAGLLLSAAAVTVYSLLGYVNGAV